MSENNYEFDAVVLGGGPCGATAAAVLAQHGRRVAVLEKARFPRYHVGESLLPYCWFTLDRIGMIDKMNAAGFIKKYSVQFASMSGRISTPFYFEDHFDHPSSQTWQVTRSVWDRMMLDNAAELGATVFEDTRAKSLVFSDDGANRVVGVVAEREGEETRFEAPLTIDCTGRDGFAINKLGWRNRDPQLGKTAAWTYYRGGKRGTGRDEGATTVAYLPEKGWFWHIPLPDDVISVGITAESSYLFRDGRDMHTIFAREIGLNAWMADVMAPAEQFGEFWVTGDYSYRSKHAAMDGLVLAGDAFAFLDPVFSSGAFLALKSGEMVADAVHAALEAGDTAAARFGVYAEELCAGIEAMRRLVYAFYDEGFKFGLLLDKHPHLRPALTDCLIGNVDRDFEPLFDAVAEFAEVPGPLPYGRPLATADSPSAPA